MKMGVGIMTTLLDEKILDFRGNVIAIKKLTTEITHDGKDSQCITREVIMLKSGKIVMEHVLYKSIININDKCQRRLANEANNVS